MLGDPFHQLPSIRAINPDQPELFTGAPESCEEETGPSRIGDRSRCDYHSHQEPQRIDQQMAFTPFDVFAFVVAALPSQFRGFDALAVEAARREVFMASCLLTHLGAQRVVETLPVSAVTPLTKIPVHTGPLGILMREHAPFEAPVNDRKDGIDHRSHIELAVAPTRFGWGDQISDKIPFGISKVCRVWCGSHPSSVLNWCHLWATFQTASKGWCDGRRMGVRPRLLPCGGRWRDRGWCGLNRLRRSLPWTGLASARQPERLTNNSRTISAEPDVYNALSVHREGVSPR